MKRLVIAAALAACARPLEPGETQCTTSNVYGTAVTNCKTGQAEAPPKPRGWWCTSRAGYGVCFREPGECEAGRGRFSAGMPPGDGYDACAFQQTSICAATCFANPASCASFERNNGRDGSQCRAFE